LRSWREQVVFGIHLPILALTRAVEAVLSRLMVDSLNVRQEIAENVVFPECLLSNAGERE
jgi:hypothetical protein